ncbi:hypothetical protein KC722_03330, partial [Candidatus Kaiserbacteria bacterium]|nr:hypothetical protein [Candidatus Kaiserbacteria bacterium]
IASQHSPTFVSIDPDESTQTSDKQTPHAATSTNATLDGSVAANGPTCACAHQTKTAPIDHSGYASHAQTQAKIADLGRNA